MDTNHHPWFIWKLIPVKDKGPFMPSGSPSGALGSGSLPSYDGATGQSSTRAQHTESEHDGFGTVVTEVTTVATNTLVTTRKKYRVEGA